MSVLPLLVVLLVGLGIYLLKHRTPSPAARSGPPHHSSSPTKNGDLHAAEVWQAGIHFQRETEYARPDVELMNKLLREEAKQQPHQGRN